ncbi:MAG TPA: BrnT family toxin [Chloroflexia bacterium]
MEVYFDDFDWVPELEEKINTKHGLEPYEVEECFYDEKLKLRRADAGKYYLYGRSESGHYIFVVFAFNNRGGKRYVRPISARAMTEKERKYYQGK